MSIVCNVRTFGAKGDGYTNDTAALQAATIAALAVSGAVYYPAGSYLITAPIFFPTTAARISVFGDGANVSVIYAQACSAFDFNFAQNGAQQPYGCVIRNLGLSALGKCDRAIRISYGNPPVTSDHNQPSCSISNVVIASNGEGSWGDGIEIEGAWNPTLDNVFISGDSCDGNWAVMHGAGVKLVGMCVNAHLSNVRCNFWAVGLMVTSPPNLNTEGLFCVNCSMVAVRRGVWIIGNATAPAPRVSTFTWVGGLIECRVKDSPDIAAAIYLDHVWTALISSAQFLAEMIPGGGPYTYGILAADSAGVVVTGCDINAWSYGFHSAGDCKALAVTGCTFTNVEKQVVFPDGTLGSRSFGHVLFNNAPFEWSESDQNKIGFVN